MTGRRAALVGVLYALVATACSFVVIRVFAGPFPIRASEWLNSGQIVTPLVAAIVVTVAAKDLGTSRASTWLLVRELPETEASIRILRQWIARTRTWRAMGFFLPPILASTAAWTVNTSGLAVDSAQRDAVMNLVSGPDVLAGWSLPIAGYAIGAAIAELIGRRHPTPLGDNRHADLRPRRPSAYLNGLAHWGPRVLAGVAVAVWLVSRNKEVAFGSSPTTLVVTVLSTLLATEVLRWIVVRRRQPAADPVEVAVDDAARSTTVHALSGSAIAIMGSSLGELISAASVDPQGRPTGAGWLGAFLGLLAVGIWLGFGVGHEWIVQRGRSSPGPSAAATTS